MSRASWIGGVSLVLLGAALAMAQPNSERPRTWRSYLIADPATEARDYWLGIQCVPVPPAVRCS